MLVVTGYTACCGQPTRKDGNYDVYVYAIETGSAFLYIRCGNGEQCTKGNTDDESEWRIVPNPRDSGQKPEPVSTGIQREPRRRDRMLEAGIPGTLEEWSSLTPIPFRNSLRNSFRHSPARKGIRAPHVIRVPPGNVRKMKG